MGNELSNNIPWRVADEEDEAAYNREFKISVIAEHKDGKPLAQIAHKHSIHLSLIIRWIEEIAENPEKHSAEIKIYILICKSVWVP